MNKILKYLIICKLGVAVIYCFVGFANPHVERQSVTLAVNQRFVIDWKFHNKDYPYLPRSLAAGDQDGILEMEFPLLNYVTTPFFYLDTPTARVLARLFCLLISAALWFYNYRTWRGIKILNIDCGLPSLLIIFMPISGVYFHRFMPDFISFILCSIALGYSIKNPKSILIPLLFASLGLLEKPPAIIAFAPLLLLENPIQQILRRLKWLIPSMMIMLSYYMFATKWMRSLSDLGRYYYTDFRNPIQSLLSFLSKPYEAFMLIIEFITPPYLIIFVLFLWARNKFPKTSSQSIKLWTIFFLQTLAIILMDGVHCIIHNYYFIGISMVAAMLWVYYYEKNQSQTWKFFMIAPLFIFNLERSFYELRDPAVNRPDSTHKMWKDSQKLKLRHPDWPWNQGYSFRSEITPISELSVGFGEIQGSKTSEYGFYQNKNQIPSDCQIVDQEGLIFLVECKK